jgi:hypothetical protein
VISLRGFVDEGKALAQVGHAAASASLLAATMIPPRKHHAENRAEEEAD